MMLRKWQFVVFLLGVGLAVPLPVGTAADKLSAYPAKILLSSKHESQSILVIFTADDGRTEDVRQLAEPAWTTGTVAEFVDGAVRPKTNGTDTLTFNYRDQSVSIDVEVRSAEQVAPVGFRRDVIPVLTRSGCNAGTCHGSSRGQDGFRLSLFGFDPRGDFHRITREMAGRRIQLAAPEASLLLQKAVGGVPHTGGKRFDVDSDAYRAIKTWLEAGAAWDEDSPQVVAMDVYPPEGVLQAPSDLGLVAVARYSDGTQRDVTRLSNFLSSDDSVAALDAHGRLVAKKRGESFVTARFDVHTVGFPVIVLPATDTFMTPAEAGNSLDALVWEKLRKLRIAPGPQCDDATFLRRVTIDTTGLLPTVPELTRFLADNSPDKRERLVTDLLARPEFTQLWAAKWAELLMIRENVATGVSRKTAYVYFEWLQRELAAGTPLDEIVRQLLAATGGTFDTPATNFHAVEQDPLKTAENVAQLFLGIRLQCAQCHNHPFDRWTMNDYYGFVDFFSGVRRKPHEDYRQWIIFAAAAETRNPVSGAVLPAKFPGGDVPTIPGVDKRVALADWITAPDNPYFARNLANRLWEHFFGRGLVDPVDDVRVSNPSSNPPLHELLAKRLIEVKFDPRALSREILMSATYQRAAPATGDVVDERNFTHAAFRRLPATTLLDCISQVTEAPEKLRGLPLGRRAVEAADQVPDNYFLQTFGRSQRASVCACETKNEPTLSQTLHLINGATIHEKIKTGQVVPKLLAAGQTPQQIVGQLYERCLSRSPTPEEVTALLATVATADTPQQGLEDVFWSILNSREFVFNH